MLSVLLPLAEATGHAAEAAVEAHGEAAASGITKLFSDFGISGPFFVAQVINFSIVAFLLWRFAFKPVLANIEARQKAIDSGLKYAAEMKAKLAATQAETMLVLQKAHAEAAKIVEDVRKTAKEYSDREHQIAAERASDLLVKAQQAIELEHKKMLEETRGEIARLVIATTQRVLSKELSDFERARFNEAASRELKVV
jgi:F-type H+-transporting ATPase subunit b